MSIILRKPSNNPMVAGFGPRPFYGYHHGRDHAYSNGGKVDLSIYAAAPGKVKSVVKSSTMGWYTVIDHGDGYLTAYAHQSKTLVAVGDVVKAGDLIGLIGETGSLAHGAHLHFELWHNGTRIDPAPYLTGGTAGGGTEITPEEEYEDMPRYIWTEEDGTGYALIDSNYVDGCIVTADPEIATQFSWLTIGGPGKGAPANVPRAQFNSECAAALALWRAHANKGAAAATAPTAFEFTGKASPV